MMDWINTNFYRDWAYNLVYPQLFPNVKRAQRRGAGRRPSNAASRTRRRWLKVLNDHWIGPNNQYLCGNQITIADYFGAALVTLGEVDPLRFFGLSQCRALAQQHEEAAELGPDQRGVLWPGRIGEAAAVPRHLKERNNEDRGQTDGRIDEEADLFSVLRRPSSVVR